jgi:hypothetical protein
VTICVLALAGVIGLVVALYYLRQSGGGHS